MAGNFKMVDMRRPKESLSPKSIGQIKPDPYSYEHKISLDQDALDKLCMEVPNVGDKFHVLGHGEVTSVSSDHDTGGKKTTRVGLQLKRLGMRPATGSTNSLFGAVNDGIKQADEEAG